MPDLTKLGIEELEKMVKVEQVKVNNLLKGAKKALGSLSAFSEAIIDVESSKKIKGNKIVNFQSDDSNVKKMNLIQEYNQLLATKQKLINISALKSEAKFNKKVTKDYLSRHLKINVSDKGALKFREIINKAKVDNALKIADLNEVFQKAKSMGYSDEAYQLLDEEDAADKIKELLSGEDLNVGDLEAQEEDEDFGF